MDHLPKPELFGLLTLFGLFCAVLRPWIFYTAPAGRKHCSCPSSADHVQGIPAAAAQEDAEMPTEMGEASFTPNPCKMKQSNQ